MPVKNFLLDVLEVTELAKLDTLSQIEFNTNKKKIFKSTTKLAHLSPGIIEKLIAYSQYDKSSLTNLKLNQQRFIEIIISISSIFPGVLTKDLLDALGQQITKKLVKRVYAKIWVENKKDKKADKNENVKKIDSEQELHCPF